jgi:type II secretory pathway pseudopilin PulG
MARRGTTLLELVVVFFLFSLLLVLILGFYVYGSSITARQERTSEAYRRAVTTLDRVETLLKNAHVYDIQSDQVIFAPLKDPQGRFLTLDSPPSTLLVYQGTLALRRGGQQQTLTILRANESLSFSGTATSHVDVRFSSTPGVGRAGEGTGRPLTLTRRVLLEN